MMHYVFLGENDRASRYNKCILNYLTARGISMPGKDDRSKNCSMSDILQAQNRKQPDTGDLAILIKMKVNARVMVKLNVGLSNRFQF